MNCDVCAIGERQSQLIQYTSTIEGRLVLVEHVPADVCDRCGEVSFSPDVVDRLQQVVRQKEPPARVIETPVYEFRKIA